MMNIANDLNGNCHYIIANLAAECGFDRAATIERIANRLQAKATVKGANASADVMGAWTVDEYEVFGCGDEYGHFTDANEAAECLFNFWVKAGWVCV